ncbi:MAG: glycosyltransferase family 2 protein [Acidimicrobiia bacterium]
MTGRPLVSLGLPTYNGARYLAATLDSLLAQDLEDLELVISDNGSTDETPDICRAAAERDARVRYHRVEQNQGAGWNYNRVLELARGPYFKWAADDDVCLPDFLRRCVELLDADGAAILAWPRTLLIDADGAPMRPLDDDDLEGREADPVARLERILRNRMEWHPVFGVIRTPVLRSTRGIGSFVSADVALLAELALRGQFHQVPDRLFHRRYHEKRSIAANPSFRAHAAWYQPDRRDRPVLPNARLVRELLVRAAEAPISRRDRARASAAVMRLWAAPHWRHIGGEVKIAARETARDLRRRGGDPQPDPVDDQGSAGQRSG